MIQKNLFIHDKRVYLKTDDYGTIDATTYVLSLVRNIYKIKEKDFTLTTQDEELKYIKDLRSKE